MKTARRAILVWLCFLVLAFVNGAFREWFMVGFLKMAPLDANQWSCLTGVTLWTLFLLFVWKKLEVNKLREAALIGAGWFMATMLFETFIIDRHLSWSQVVDTYDVSAGEYWGLVLLWIGFMPLAVYSLNAMCVRRLK